VMGQDWRFRRCHARPSFLLFMAVLPYRTNRLDRCIQMLPNKIEGSKSAQTACDLEWTQGKARDVTIICDHSVRMAEYRGAVSCHLPFGVKQ